VEERVAGVQDLRDGEMMSVQVGGRKVLLARVGGRFYATAARCPHWGGPLPEGTLHGTRLLCPWHKGTFDVRSGDLLEPPPLDGIATYPVRVDGDDVFVDGDEAARPDATTGAAAAADERLFIVIGGGAAGGAAVEELRRQGYAGRLLLISDEDSWPYDRPNLSKDYLAGELEARWLPLRQPEFYEAHAIERRVARVTRLDVTSRTIALDDGGSLTADAVLVATGGVPRRLGVSGGDAPGVFTLRSRRDAEALIAAAKDARTAVLVGGGFIGMEAAASLVRRGLSVTVVARGTPLGGAVGDVVGRVVQARHEAHGSRFLIGREVTAIREEGPALLVQLDDGSELACDLVIVGLGIEPATGFVEGAARAADGGLLVSESMALAPGVWAAGDIASYREPYGHRDVRIEHWRVAEQQGRAAARAMAGAAEPFAAVPFFWTQHFDLQLSYAGVGRGFDDLVMLGDPETGDFLALYASEGRLLAACGTRDRELGAFMELMRLGRLPSVGEVKARPDIFFTARLQAL